MGLISQLWEKSGGELQLEAEPATSGDIVEALKPLILLPDNEVSFLFRHLPLPLLINAQHSTFSLADGLVGDLRAEEAGGSCPFTEKALSSGSLWVLQTQEGKLRHHPCCALAGDNAVPYR